MFEPDDIVDISSGEEDGQDANAAALAAVERELRQASCRPPPAAACHRLSRCLTCAAARRCCPAASTPPLHATH